MNEIEFSQEQLGNLSKVVNIALDDDQDPRSVSYVRILKRPPINWFRICLFLFFPLAFTVVVYILLAHIGMSTTLRVISVISIIIGYTIINAKRAVLCLIKIYQRYSPSAIRNKCRFEPSCSEYMMMSIQKYGLIQGAKKGISRLKRCNVNGGGFDYP